MLVWYTLSCVPHVFWIFSFLCWSNMLLLNPKYLNTQDIVYAICISLPLKKYWTPTKYPPQKIGKTFFMSYRRQSVPKHCTKLTLSALQPTLEHLSLRLWSCMRSVLMSRTITKFNLKSDWWGLMILGLICGTELDFAIFSANVSISHHFKTQLTHREAVAAGLSIIWQHLLWV